VPVIAGEPGIGKTTIWADGITQSRLAGTTVGRGLQAVDRPRDAALQDEALKVLGRL